MAVYKDKERGTWYASFYYDDWTGERKRKLKRGFKTKKEALAFEAEYQRQSKPDMEMTFGEFVEVYFRDKSGELKARTTKNKKTVIETKLLPYFKDKPMNQITPSDIIQWQNTMREKGYSQDYLKLIQNQMTALFSHAKTIYGLFENPCTKVKRMGKTSKKKMEFWTLEEYRQFMEGIEPGTRYHTLFELLYWTGLRIGEALALFPSDIDFERCEIHVTKTFYRMDGEVLITSPKTEESNRTISIPEFLKKELQEYIAKLYELPDNERIFPIGHEAVQHKLKNECVKSGVKKIRVHDLRHSHAAYLINQGVQPLMIKERFGHTDIRITLNTYGHLYPNQQQILADMLEETSQTAEPGQKRGEINGSGRI
jgi:integrase